jgi:YheC/D like ATP-grasp
MEGGRSDDSLKKDRSQPQIGFCVSRDYYPGLLGLVTHRLQFAPDDVAFIRFHLKDIDFDNLQVKGDKFHKDTGEWKEGVFPIPDVVYMQCSANREDIKRIENVIGHNVFNSFIFDKWQGWNLLNNDKELRGHLPNTQLFHNNIDLINFLNKYHYKDVILKPIFGYSSEGIFRIKFQENKKIQLFHKQGLKMEMQEFPNYTEFWNFLSLNIHYGSYIIQQSIETIKQRENVSDIRLNMNKNSKGQWEVSLLLFRVATNSSIVIPLSISVFTLDNFMKSSIYKKEKMGDIEKSILDLGHKICHAFDKSGYHMADLGIDIGMDENGHLWIFEVNPLPYPTMGSVRDYSLTRPVEYALYLASQKS